MGTLPDMDSAANSTGGEGPDPGLPPRRLLLRRWRAAQLICGFALLACWAAAQLEIGHRLCGRGWLLRLEMPQPRGDPARGTLSLEGLLRVGELEADAREIARELSAIARDTAWAWLDGRGRS